jgi:hypothetical protein
MSARELKTALHERIEALTDEQTLQVYEFFSTQYGEEEPTDTSSELLEELRSDLEKAQHTDYKGITTTELQQKMTQWLTR